MSTRTKARKEALDQLFASDLRGKDLSIPDEIRDYGRELLTGIIEKKSRIDELIRSYSQGWDLDRLPAVDRNILRLAIYELLWSTQVPEAVAIDEALNFARELSTEDSAKFVHGVLGKIAALKSQLI
jgi:N utilization substance protein B